MTSIWVLLTNPLDSVRLATFVILHALDILVILNWMFLCTILFSSQQCISFFDANVSIAISKLTFLILH